MALHEKKILLLNNQGLEEAGGGVTMLEELTNYFSVKNQVTLLSEGQSETTSINGNLNQQTIMPEAYHTKPFLWRLTPVLSSRSLRKRLRDAVKGYDVIIALDCRYAAALWPVCRNALKVYISLSAIPVVGMKDVHGPRSHKFLVFLQYAVLERRAFQQADIACVASQRHLAEVQKYEWLTMKPAVVYPVMKVKTSGTETGQELDALRERVGGVHKHILLTVTRIIPLKNLEYLLDLAEKLQRDDILFLIVGEGEQRAALQQEVRQRGLEQRVRFTGYQQNPAGFYRMADIYIHPSCYESFSCAIYEAMLFSLPVILPKNTTHYVSAFEELLQGDDALCLNFEEQDEVCEAISRLFENEERRKQIGRRGRDAALALQKSYAREIEHLIEEH